MQKRRFLIAWIHEATVASWSPVQLLELNMFNKDTRLIIPNANFILKPAQYSWRYAIARRYVHYHHLLLLLGGAIVAFRDTQCTVSSRSVGHYVTLRYATDAMRRNCSYCSSRATASNTCSVVCNDGIIIKRRRDIYYWVSDCRGYSLPLPGIGCDRLAKERKPVIF